MLTETAPAPAASRRPRAQREARCIAERAAPYRARRSDAETNAGAVAAGAAGAAGDAGPLAEHELTALWLLGRVPQPLLPWPLLRPGRAGRGAGPDVREAVFVRDGVPLAGDVEVHLRASDFGRHGHASDHAYDGVVLHLVWRDDLDGPVSLAGGATAPAVAVQPALRTPARLRARLRLGPRLPPPCTVARGRTGQQAGRRAGPSSGAEASQRADERATVALITERVRAEGRRRLAERVCRAARLAEREGWDGAWQLLLERALHSSAGRRKYTMADTTAEATGAATPGTPGRPARTLDGAEPWPLLEPLAHDGRPGPLIEALRGPPLVPGPLGRGRAAEVGWNAALPLLTARAVAYGDIALGGGTAALAASWPAPRPYGPTRALAAALTGAERTPRGGGALWAQGLLHTQELWCRRGGCGACPFSAGGEPGG